MNVLQKFKDPHYGQYSTIALGGASAFFSLIAALMLEYMGLSISVFVCFLVFLILVGIVLQIRSNRVLYIRIYQLVVFSTLVFSFLVVAILFLTDGGPLWQKWFVVIVMTIIAVLLGVLAFFRTRQLYTPTMPHGPLGILNPNTGVVDPTKSPPKLQEKIEEYSNKTNFVWRVIPLTAGLALAFVRGLSDSGGELVMAIIAIIVVVGVSGSIGSVYAYIRAILCWEKKHGKRITVKR